MAKKNLPIIIIILLTILGGLGSIIAKVNLTVGIILIVTGIFVAVYRIIASEIVNSALNKQLEAQNILLASKGVGNVYQEIFESEMKRKKRSPSGAIKLLIKAYKLEPDKIEVIEELSSHLALQLSFSQWVTDCEPSRMEARADWRFAKDIAEEGLKKKPNSHLLMDALGILNDVKGDHELAREWFLKSSKVRSDPYWRLLMSTSWGLSGRDDKALEEEEQVINQGERSWFLNLHFGNTLVHCGKCDEGIKYLNLAKKIRGMHPTISFDKLFALLNLSRFNISITLDVIYLSIFLTYVESWRSIPRVVRINLMYFFSIINSISRNLWRITSKVRILRNTHFNIYSPCGFAFSNGENMSKKENYKSALNYYTICYSICPKSIGVLINLSFCYGMLGEKEKSIKTIDEGLAIEPQNRILLWNKEQIKSGLKLNPRFDASPKDFREMPK